MDFPAELPNSNEALRSVDLLNSLNLPAAVEVATKQLSRASLRAAARQSRKPLNGCSLRPRCERRRSRVHPVSQLTGTANTSDQTASGLVPPTEAVEFAKESLAKGRSNLIPRMHIETAMQPKSVKPPIHFTTFLHSSPLPS